MDLTLSYILHLCKFLYEDDAYIVICLLLCFGDVWATGLAVAHG